MRSIPIFVTALVLALIFNCDSYRQLVSESCRNSLHLRAKNNKGSSKSKFAELISIADPDSDLWKVDSVLDILKNGGVGVITTDTCYSFVTKVTSTKGADKIAKLKGMQNQKKPMSLLCKDFSMISKYTSSVCEQKW